MLHIERARDRYRAFIDSTRKGEFDFSLTPRAESTAYARCFAVFGYGLLRVSFGDAAEGLAQRMVIDLDSLKERRLTLGVDLSSDKPYLQLLTFTLSALSLLERPELYSLIGHVEPLIGNQIGDSLRRCGALEGRARSGNQAMFLAILLLYAGSLGIDTKERIDEWEQLHRNALNRFGFWGPDGSMSHLQFQNGYHQYEIFEYLRTPNIPWLSAADAVACLADNEGHFAPYPGGGGCYDYDAVFLLTADSGAVIKHATLLNLIANTLMSEQNDDGGFCESKMVRPRSLGNVARSISHALKGRGKARLERVHQAVTLLRPKHNVIHTHWSNYSREWSESDLWDSWFRMLALARIDCALNPKNCKMWGFINFPGIGFHPCKREEH